MSPPVRVGGACFRRCALATATLGLAATALTGQSACPGGQMPVGDIGVGMYHCVAGACGIHDGLDRRFYTFSVEPQIWNVNATGRAVGRLRDRDILVRVDHLLITSDAGGRRLANLVPHTRVQLTIRRDGVEHDIEIETGRACAIPMLIWTRDPTGSAPRLGVGSLEDAGPEPDPTPPGATLGVRVSCRECGWVVTPGGILLWRTASAPVVQEVDPGGPAEAAGLRPGDLLTHVDGHSLLEASGGRRMATLTPGEVVTVTFERDGTTRTTRVTATARDPVVPFP